MKKTILIFGAGPGIGQAVAQQFGKQGFAVALVSRRLENLQPLVDELQQQQITATAYAADLTDPAAIARVVADVLLQWQRIDVVHYNAAAVRMVPVLQETAATLTEDFKVNVAGLLTVALEAQNALAEVHGALLVTGGGFALYPMPEFASLSVGKAGVRNLANSLHQALAEKGIFVGTVTVKGYVSPEAEIYHPKNIAEHFWKLYHSRNAFELSL
ncbi:MAG: SDR family NAD(P)-dependent oxidoreductase [Chitinophagales bacterium]